jgi:hypothetical protein
MNTPVSKQIALEDIASWKDFYNTVLPGMGRGGK